MSENDYIICNKNNISNQIHELLTRANQQELTFDEKHALQKLISLKTTAFNVLNKGIDI